MRIQEVCRACNLTKKAVEYYEGQRLVEPRILANGYRDYSAEDVERLKKVAVLRKLGLPAAEIRMVLEDGGPKGLARALDRKALELDVLKEKQELFQALADSMDWEEARLRLEALERRQTILERLLDAFPGYYGRYLSLHFSLYLREPIVTQEQQEAFEQIVAFLDGVSFELPDDLREYFDEAARGFDEGFVLTLSENLDRAVRNPEQYLEENRETLEQYLAYKQSEEFRATPAYRLQEHFARFNRQSGYNEVFLPAMKKLSRTYREYCEAMERANEVFLERYPQGRS